VDVKDAGLYSSPIDTTPSPHAVVSQEPATSTVPEADDPSMVHRQIDPNEVVQVMRPSLPKVKQCLKEALKREPGTEGELKLKFVINHDGAVVHTQDNGTTFEDEEIVKCVSEVLKTLKFPVRPAPGGEFGIYRIHVSG
jgi:hypothetical protein